MRPERAGKPVNPRSRTERSRAAGRSAGPVGSRGSAAVADLEQRRDGPDDSSSTRSGTEPTSTRATSEPDSNARRFREVNDSRLSLRETRKQFRLPATRPRTIDPDTVTEPGVAPIRWASFASRRVRPLERRPTGPVVAVSIRGCARRTLPGEREPAPFERRYSYSASRSHSSIGVNREPSRSKSRPNGASTTLPNSKRPSSMAIAANPSSWRW